MILNNSRPFYSSFVLKTNKAAQFIIIKVFNLVDRLKTINLMKYANLNISKNTKKIYS